MLLNSSFKAFLQTAIIPLLASTINSNEQNIVTGNIISIPSNSPSHAQIIFTNKQTLEEHITETDPETGEYSISLLTGNYRQEVLNLEHYYYHDDDFQINSNRRDSIETIKSWIPIEPVYKPYGPEMGLFVIKSYTNTLTADPEQFIEAWALYERPIKYWFENKARKPTYVRLILDAFEDITRKSNNNVQFQEVYTEPVNGIKIYFRHPNDMPYPSTKTYATIKKKDENNMILMTEEYYNTEGGLGNINIACREHMRCLGFSNNSIDPTSVLTENGGIIYNQGLNDEDAKVAEYVYSMKHMPKDMSKHDTTIVREWKPNAIRINEPKSIDQYILQQNHPNPFNQQTTITYSTPTTANIQINIYNIEGKHIKKILEQKHTPGTYTETLNMHGHPSGTYIIKLQTETEAKTIRVLYIK